ncbi:MAG: rRNA maturation RNase YbeY [Acidobacteriales bacterium]|nr:rRNA maturation RNase YbeY [Terriglobales bacterium]
MTVSFQKTVPGLSELAMKRFVRRAADAVKLRGSVSVRIAGDRELQALNQQFRGKDHPTDVLSFPAGDAYASTLAGDIAISADIATRNARVLGHPVSLEIKILALHGLLHLAGHDHESDRGQMAALEQRLRRELRLPAALIERNHADAASHTLSPRPTSRKRMLRP